MNVSIQKARLEDIPSVQKIAYSTWPHTFSEILSSDQIGYMLNWMYNTKTLTRQFESKNFQFMLSICNNTCCGFISIEVNYNNSQTTKIHKLYILPNFQGHGIGKKLLESTYLLAKNSGNTKITLNVNRHNPATDFYTKAGFEIVREEIIDIGNGYVMDDYVYEMSIK